MEDKLLDLIQKSERIFITSHISPDTDAVSSVLLFGTTLQKNFPDKKIKMALDEVPTRSLIGLSGSEAVEFGSIYAQLTDFKPQLFVMLDVANFNRTSRDNGEKIEIFLKQNGVKTVSVDHHEESGHDKTDVYINNLLPATVQQVYEVLFEELKLEKPAGYAETTLIGILSDTNRFKYQNPKHRQTFDIVSQLLDAGASIEKLETQAERYEKDELIVLAEFLRNASTDSSYTYSFLSDEFVSKWRADGKQFSAIKNGSDLFTNNYLRNIGENFWGFAVYKEYPSGDNTYSARFRAIDGSGDMSQLAAKLGGGGHKGAAGSKFQAQNLEDALNKVKAAIKG